MGISRTAPQGTGGIILQGPLLPMKDAREMLPRKPELCAFDHFGVKFPSAHPSFGGSWGRGEMLEDDALCSVSTETRGKEGASSWKKVARGLRSQGGSRSGSALSPPSYPAACSIPPGGLLFLSLLLLRVFYPGVH
uniref:uncharacterized protein LOC107000663 n=1 Tax=Macaca mulatta TaxID=9544 RepID=UPI0007328F59|nr:uncharacterized protein LOC107000663 [Macaca mulatta]